MLKKALPMNLSAARLAAMHARMQEAVPTAVAVKCSKQPVQAAERPAKSHSSPAMTALFTAVTALQTEDKS